MEWDFARFNPSHISATVNQIIISYSKPITEVQNGSSVIQDSIANKEIEGFPSGETMNNITSHMAKGGGFKIERMIRPEIKIKLER